VVRALHDNAQSVAERLAKKRSSKPHVVGIAPGRRRSCQLHSGQGSSARQWTSQPQPLARVVRLRS
jgi:hypothetical protein